MKTLRVLLLLTILLLIYTAVLIVIMWPGVGWIMGFCVVIGFSRRRAQRTELGSARWADISDLTHVID